MTHSDVSVDEIKNALQLDLAKNEFDIKETLLIEFEPISVI